MGDLITGVFFGGSGNSAKGSKPSISKSQFIRDVRGAKLPGSVNEYENSGLYETTKEKYARNMGVTHFYANNRKEKVGLEQFWKRVGDEVKNANKNNIELTGERLADIFRKKYKMGYVESRKAATLATYHFIKPQIEEGLTPDQIMRNVRASRVADGFNGMSGALIAGRKKGKAGKEEILKKAVGGVTSLDIGAMQGVHASSIFGSKVDEGEIRAADDYHSSGGSASVFKNKPTQGVVKEQNAQGVTNKSNVVDFASRQSPKSGGTSGRFKGPIPLSKAA